MLVKENTIQEAIMGYHSNLAINSSVAKSAHHYVCDGLKHSGWEEDGDLESKDEQLFTFVGTLVHEDYSWSLTITYNIDETVLVAVCVELESGTYIDCVKKGFPNNNEDMEEEEMLCGAIKAVEMGMQLFQLEQSEIETPEMQE